MHVMRRLVLAVGVLTAAATIVVMGAGPFQAPAGAPGLRQARHVIVITLDGMRWQEMFGGAERALMGRNDKDIVGSSSYKRFWRAGVEARRVALMPFFWSVVARDGQVFGSPAHQSFAHVTNRLWFSYPGYSEMLAGVADPRVDSNAKRPNPNINVLEWLNQRPGFEGRVEAFGAWDVLPFILNAPRSRLPIGDGYPPVPAPRTDRERAINDVADDLPLLWDGAPLDAPIMQAALESLRAHRPRVLYVLLGETDEWAHENRYDLYLDAAFRSDRFIRRMWETAQSMPEYAGQTALVLATDHGRGASRKDWTDHGRKVPAAERTWMAVIGPGTEPLGLRRGVTVANSQIAATIAALMGEDFRTGVPAAAPPLPGITMTPVSAGLTPPEGTVTPMFPAPPLPGITMTPVSAAPARPGGTVTPTFPAPPLPGITMTPVSAAPARPGIPVTAPPAASSPKR
jgi:hypothetical protein